MTSWHEDDAFWEALAPGMFGPKMWERAPREVAQLIELMRLGSGEAVLDLCCGPGRHALELARRGFRITGVDRTSSYLRSARDRAEEEALEVEFVQSDMRAFCREASFRAALLLSTSFGYFEDPADNRQVLSNVLDSLDDGGALLVDVMGSEVLARIFAPRDWTEFDGGYLLQERTVTNGWRWMDSRWILLRDGEEREFNVTHWIYSAAELCGLLSDAGFASVELFGDFGGSPYDPAARRLIAVARKRAAGGGEVPGG